MNKSHIALGVLAGIIVVLGVISVRQAAPSMPSASTIAAPAGAAQGKTILVTYTDTGFKPPVIKMARGSSIHFRNEGGRALRIAPLIDPAFSETAYRGFESPRSIKRGESFTISVTLPGVWGYQNLNSPASVGVAIVE